MRVLFSCVPAYGHLLPLIPLARACRRAGHEVLVATGPDLCPEVERLGLAAAPTGLSLVEIAARYRAAFPGVEALPADEQMRYDLPHAFVGIAARTRAAELVALARDWAPDLIVHESCEFAAPIAAALAGAARAIHGLGVPVPAGLAALCAGAVEDLFAEWGLDRATAESLWAAPYLDIYPRGLRPEGALAVTDIRPLRPGPVEPPAGGRLPDQLDRLPHDRTVYVTLGTAFNEVPGVFEAILAGLRDEPVNLIVTTGPGGDPARFGPQREGIVIEQFLSQALVLPRCDAVISHAGSGTVLGALAHGLPQVLLPLGADQFLNAAACAGAGAGTALQPGELTPEVIRAATRRILAEPGSGERAHALAAEIAAMPDADAVLADLAREVRPLARSR